MDGIRCGRRTILSITALVSVLVTPATAPALGSSASAAPPRICRDKLGPNAQTLTAATIRRRVLRGQPIVFRGVYVPDGVELPAQVRTPFVLTDACIAGIVGHSTEFANVVDLSRTTFFGPVNLYSGDFDRSALLDGARFKGPTSFDSVEFHGAAVFASTEFDATRAPFGRADIQAPADFMDATFDRGADFTSATFRGTTAFDNSQFASFARFTDVRFLQRDTCGPTGGISASFLNVHFDGGADFTGATFQSNAYFDKSTARADVAFQDARFDRKASFNTILFGGAADFSGATFGCMLDLNQADIARVDLTGSHLSKTSTFNYPQRPGRIDELEADTSVIARISNADAALYGSVETSARRAGDLPGANEAHVLRLSLERGSDLPVEKQLDWLFYWGVAGYFVRPWHPFFAIGALLLIGALARGIGSRRASRPWRDLPADAAGGVAALAAFKDIPETAKRAFGPKPRPGKNEVPPEENEAPPEQKQAPPSRRKAAVLVGESVVFKILIAVLLVDLAAVSPPIRDFAEHLL
jgi:hypothetical protein